MNLRISTGISLLFAMGALCFAGGATATEITSCLQTDTGIDCEERSVFTIPVTFGVTRSLEVFETDLAEPVELELSKSQPLLFYPLSYLHTVAYYPTENPLPFEVKKAEECTLTPNCFLAEGNKGSGGTCHCFDPGELTFHGYEIGGYGESFDVKLKMVQGSESHTAMLNPADAPTAFYATKHDTEYMGTFDLRVSLVGEGGRYASAPDLANYLLYIPAAPADHAMVTGYQDNLLLVPREETTQDGRECNRVGVDVEAFEAWVEAGVLGTCLDGQLFHKHNADLQELVVNPDYNTRYLVSGKRPFRGSMSFIAGMSKRLVYQVPEIAYSQVALDLPRTTLKEIWTDSKGIILDASVKTFESLSNQGLMVVNIKNIGDFRTDYLVEVGKCTMNISGTGRTRGISIPAQARTLGPQDELELSFEIRTIHNLDTPNNECLVTLKSSTGKIYDDMWVKFDTKKHGSE